MDVDGLIAGARRHEQRSIARLISLVEDGHPRLPEVMAALAPHTGHAVVIGLTGPPGVGKSTTTSALIALHRKQGRRVGVLAVDPSSPFSGGALLGDRVRMHDHTTDPGVYIRSMAGRGHLGGLSVSTPQAVRVLDAAGFDVILIETVGVGQSEVEVAATADTTIVLLAPGMGDGIQAAKAGILEVGDVFVVNKADREGASTTARELRQMLAMTERADGDWRPPVIRMVATTGSGIGDVENALDEHRAWLEASGGLTQRRRSRAAAEIEAIVMSQLRARIAALPPEQGLPDLAEAVAAGRQDPHTAARLLTARLQPPPTP